MAFPKLVVALALVSTALAAIDKFDVPGTYSLQIGTNACPPTVSVDSNATLSFLQSGKKYSCSKPTKMELGSASATARGDSLTAHLTASKLAEDFPMGSLKDGMTCTPPAGGSPLPAFVVPANSTVNIFSPSNTTRLDFNEIQAAGSDPDAHKHHGADGHSAGGHEGHSDGKNSTKKEAGHMGGHSNGTKHGGAKKDGAHKEGGHKDGAGHESHNHARFIVDYSVRLSTNRTGGGKGEMTVTEGVQYMSIADECMYRKTKAAACFPGESVVALRSGGTKRMDELTVGDVVQSGKGVWSSVFMWTHADASATSDFVKLTTASGHSLSLSHGHYVYADGKSVPADTVRVGDRLTIADGTTSNVVRVEEITGEGLFNPQTVSGDIVVDGVVATTYTTAVAPGAAHAMLAPVRYAFKMVAAVVEGVSVEL